MSGSDRFLSRWSRRKQEARLAAQPGDGAAGAAAGEPIAQSASSPVHVESPAAVSEPALSAEELARLPRLDELTAESDLTVFLRAGVPEPLRNAALRRAWALDPKIRDYVSEAREYAYDWNRPGDLPGNGPLPRDFDVKALVGRLFREPGPAVPPDDVAAQLHAATADQPRQSRGPSDAGCAPPPESGTTGRLASNESAMATPASAAPVRSDSSPGDGAAAPAAAPPDPSRTRRHGGAIPH